MLGIRKPIIKREPYIFQENSLLNSVLSAGIPHDNRSYKVNYRVGIECTPYDGILVHNCSSEIVKQSFMEVNGYQEAYRKSRLKDFEPIDSEEFSNLNLSVVIDPILQLPVENSFLEMSATITYNGSLSITDIEPLRFIPVGKKFPTGQKSAIYAYALEQGFKNTEDLFNKKAISLS